jgi:hypothetical protein
MSARVVLMLGTDRRGVKTERVFVPFWLRLSKKPRHIGGVKQWNQGGTDADSFLPQVVTKRINLSVLSG